MKILFLVAALTVGGCTSPSTIKTELVRTYPSGVVEKVKTSLKGPEYAISGSSLNVTTNGVYGALSASQDAKGIEGVKGEAAGSKLLYGALALILTLSAVALFLPEKIVKNKDALLGAAISIAGYAIVRYTNASASVMKWVIPTAAVGYGIYLVIRWRKSKGTT